MVCVPCNCGESAYLGVGDRLESIGNVNPIHRYLQYEARLFSDSGRRETPQVEYIKFTLADGTVLTDSTEGDFTQGTPVQNIVQAPAESTTPFFGLSRLANGGFLTSGVYRSAPIDSGRDAAVWDQIRWRLPEGVANNESGLFALYRLDGTWVDVAPFGGTFTPSVQQNTAFSTAARLGFNAALFDANGGASQISGFFPSERNLSTMSFWVNPDLQSGEILQVGGGRIRIRNGQVVADDYGNNSPAIYVNANPINSHLRPGWNHIVLVWPSIINALDLAIGGAGGEPFSGLLDELALYERMFTKGQVQVQYLSAQPLSSGNPSFRVRTANSIANLATAPWSASFTDPLFANFVLQGRYLQYEMTMSGDGSGTPVASRITVSGNDGVTTFEISPNDFSTVSQGEFVGNAIAWYGDSLYVSDFAATDPSNLAVTDFEPSDVLAGLWHFDERVWEATTVLLDSSGLGRNAAPVNGAQSVPNARVGIRAGSFDGVGQYVQLGQVSELAGPAFSAALWFNSRDTEPGALISTFSETNPYFEIRLNHDGVTNAPGRVAFVVNDRAAGGLRAVVSPAENLNNGAWRHVVGVRAANAIHLYIDGVRVASANIGATYGPLAPATPRIMRNGSGSQYLSGFVDEVVMFGSALSPRKVGTVFSSG